jgi:LuxR family maltose regulon positive regulatory protein
MPLSVMAALEVPQLTQARVLLAQADAASLTTARGLLQTVWSAAETMHNVWRMVETLALQALLYQTQGQIEPALATLATAVTLARPGRFIRIFVDLGPALAGLLYQLVTRGVEPDYLGEVLTAFPPLPGAADRAQQIRQVTQVKLIEPLTERESEILLCLHKELPNKTIADALKISLLTVKRHTTNLYQKLGVETRKQAVSRARSLGILPAGHEWDSRSVRQ